MEKWLKTIIKGAAVIPTAPATLAVAGDLYPDNPLQRIPVQIAALVLVEGALLLGWQMLDAQRGTTAQRFMYAALATAAYVALWVIAISHGEGAAGIVFRLTLGVLLGYSVFESGILASIKVNREIDRDVQRAGEVQKHRRRAEMKVAKLEIDRWEQLESQRIKLELEGGSKTLQAKHHKALYEELQAIKGPESSRPTAKRGTFPYPVDRLNQHKQLTKAQRLDLLKQHIAEQPDSTPTALCQWAIDHLGVAESTGWSYLGELRGEAVQAQSNGRG